MSGDYLLPMNKKQIIATVSITPPLVIFIAVLMVLGLRKLMPAENRTIKNLEWVGWNIGLFAGTAIGMVLSYYIAARGVGMGIVNSNTGKDINLSLLNATGLFAGAAVGLSLSAVSMAACSAGGRYFGRSFMTSEPSDRVLEEAIPASDIPMVDLGGGNPKASREEHRHHHDHHHHHKPHKNAHS